MDDRDEINQLLSRIALRDAKAFETLYRKVASRLMAVAMRAALAMDGRKRRRTLPRHTR